MKRWLYPLISGVVVTICVLTVIWAVDCHRIAKVNRMGSEAVPELCKDADSRALATLMGVLSTLLALAVRSDDETPGEAPTARGAADRQEVERSRGGDSGGVGQRAGVGGEPGG